jgi:hypothetical protein
MNQITAYCGLVCSDCPAYTATQADDQAALERVAALWRKEYDAPGITVESVICDGCLNGGRKCSHCAECEIRACGFNHGVLNCAYCHEYPCQRLESFFEMVPDARITLDEIHVTLA